MSKVIPVIVVCSVGIAVALGYIVFVAVRSVLARSKSAYKPNEFEIDEDTLTIKLGRRRKRKGK